jgi:hypothetical protein
LHKQNIRKGEHEDFWKIRKTLDAQPLRRALYIDKVLRLIRGEIRRREGILLDEEELARAVHDMLSVNAREKMRPMKIRRKRQRVPKKTDVKVVTGT